MRNLLCKMLNLSLSVTCQLPLLILTIKYLLSNVVDRLFVLYIILLLIYVWLNLMLFVCSCLSPNLFWKKDLLNEEKLFVDENQSTSSRALTVIDRQIHPSFQYENGIATENVLVMH